MGSLAIMHADGRGGLPKDREKALELFRKAARLGDALSQCNIYAYFLHEYKPTVTENEAVSHLEKAALVGYPGAYQTFAAHPIAMKLLTEQRLLTDQHPIRETIRETIERETAFQFQDMIYRRNEERNENR